MTESNEQRLPSELYRPIVQSIVDPNALTRIALVSRFMQVEAERALYQSLHWYTYKRSVQACLALSRSPRRAASVEELVIKIDPNVSTVNEEVFFQTVHRLWTSTLLLLPSLHSLTLTTSGFYDWIVCRKAYPFNLRYFSCLDPDDKIVSFLSSQTDIRVMQLTGTPRGPPIRRPNSLPTFSKLHTIHGFNAVFKLFIPGNPVREVNAVQWWKGRPKLQETLESMRFSTVSITGLVLALAPGKVERPLRTIARALPSLIKLHVRFYDEVPWLPNEWAAALAFLPDLEVLKLSHWADPPVESDPPMDAPSTEIALKQFSSICRRLRNVEISHRGRWVLQDSSRWEVNSG